MKMKKIVALGLAGSLVAGMLAGCSGKGDEASGKADSGVTELELFSSKMENVSTLQSLVDSFNEQNPDIKITLNAPADAGTVLKTRMTKDDLPDILAYGGDNRYTELTDVGVLVDLSDEDFIKTINPSYMNMLYQINADRDEKAYGAPFATNASGVIYNVDLFKEAGVEVPATWDEFMEVCETLKNAGIQPFEFTFKDGWTTLLSWNAMAADLQPENFLFDRMDGKTTFTGTHEEVLEKYLQVIQYGQADYMGTSYDDGNRNFANGSAAMLINGSWTVPELKKTNPDINLDMFAYPTTNDEAKNLTASGIDVLLAVTTQCKNPEAAKKFVSFMLQPENSQQYMEEQFAFSPVEGVMQEDESVASLAKNITDGKVVDFSDHYYPSGYDLAAILSEFFLNRENGMADQENIEATLKKCDEQYDILNVN